MPLPLTSLDKLKYDELVADARRSLPALAPDWTDYNAHDPGITLIELLAWLAETDSYRLDQISESAYRAFLRMAGIELRTPEVARTTLVFEPINAALNIPAGKQVEAPGSKVAFCTTAPVYVSAAKLTAVFSAASSAVENLTDANLATASFAPFGTSPKPNDALYLGFDAPLADRPAEISLWIFTGRDEEDFETIQRLRGEHEAATSDAERWCPDFHEGKTSEWHTHYGVRTQWEFHAGAGEWRALQQVIDETRALSLGGSVRFQAPAPDEQVVGGAAIPALVDKYVIRCRLVQGAYDCPPRIAKVAVNGTLAVHAVEVASEQFESTGRASQKFLLRHKPVAANSVALTIEDQSGTVEEWQARYSFDGVGPHDEVYAVSSRTGTIQFGDGRVGRVPPAGAALTVKYRIGGGAIGNILGLERLTDTNIAARVSQPFVAYGGRDEETLDAAKARAVNELAARTRAVTKADYESLALSIPGLPIARAHAIEDYHPRMHCIRVNGCITVVLVPACYESEPQPTSTLLSAARTYLERRRILTSELCVVGPELTTVSVRARLHVTENADARDVIARARTALDKFLHALRGGQDGSGYPIGRAVYRSELMALLNEVAGVEYVASLTWRADDGPWSQCSSIEMCPHGLPVSGAHEIKIDERNNCHE